MLVRRRSTAPSSRRHADGGARHPDAEGADLDPDEPTPGFSSIEDALADVAAGKFVVVLDDEDRERLRGVHERQHAVSGLQTLLSELEHHGQGVRVHCSLEEVKDGYLDHYGKVMSDEEVQAMFDSVDTDKSGFIDYSEFVVAAMNENQLTTNEKLAAAFKMFDKDGSGELDKEEVARSDEPPTLGP